MFGFSYWMDCSVYDDLINTIEAQISNTKMRAAREAMPIANSPSVSSEQMNQIIYYSKYWDELRSLQKEYDSAVQQKSQCLSNTSNSSNTTYYNNNYQNDTYHKSQSQICKEEFWNYSIAIWDECGCKDWYIMNWTLTKCVKDTVQQRRENCLVLYGNKSYYSDDDEMCMCVDWYTMNENRSKCVVATFEQRNSNCSAWNNWNAHYSEEEKTCVCNTWYMPNEDKSQCVKDTERQRKLNCSTRYWDNAILWDNWEDCECSGWYVFNEEGMQCVLDTKEQREKNCKSWYSPLSFLWDDWESCECPEGYFADSNNTNYCVLDRSQKSLQSRIMNTKDAQCDDTIIQITCSIEPTNDGCPAVCLELYDAINWMYANELTIYNDPTKFGIYDPITREQASKFFVNFYMAAFDKKPFVTATNPFNDIDNADPTLRMYIINSSTLKLFKGSNWKFMPFNHLTKAQALAVMIRMATWLLDESQQPRYSNYLNQAESMELLDNINYSYATLDDEDIVRWDVALILYRLYDYLK